MMMPDERPAAYAAYLDAVSTALADGTPHVAAWFTGGVALDSDGCVDLAPIVLPAVALLCVLVEHTAEATGTTPDAVLFDLRQRVSELEY